MQTFYRATSHIRLVVMYGSLATMFHIRPSQNVLGGCACFFFRSSTCPQATEIHQVGLAIIWCTDLITDRDQIIRA